MGGTIRALALSVLIYGCGGGGGDTVDASLTPDAGTCGDPVTFFMNRGGGDFTPGPDDPATNTSSIITEPETIPAFTEMGDPEWQALLACVTDMVSPFNIVITDTEPGAEVVYREIVFRISAKLPC